LKTVALPGLYEFCGHNPIVNIDPSGLYDFSTGGLEFDNSDVDNGLNVGWAGFSSAVWSIPGLSNLNNSYNLYQPCTCDKNDPSFQDSQILGDVGLDSLALAGGAAAWTATRGAIGVAAAVPVAASRPVIIGETMDRVKAYAADVGGEFYNPDTFDPTDEPGELAKNAGWFQSVLDEGRDVIDIGYDPGYREYGSSPYYNMEKDMSAFYPYLQFDPQP
jgi:hypothetical protein